MSAPVSILLTRLRYLGDVILTTPLVQRTREEFPDAKIGYLVEEPFAPALEACPDIDRVHVLPVGASAAAQWGLIRGLRRERYDWAIDLFGNPRSALLCWSSGASRRVGSQRGLRSRLYHHRRGRPPGDRSAILHHLDKLVPLLESHGVQPRGEEAPPTRLWLRPEERRRAREFWASSGGGEWVLLHPGSKWRDKAWPLPSWQALARQLSKQTGARVAVVRPPGEEAAARAVVESGEGLLALPPLGLRELFAVLSEARLYVGNDGGILHASVALGVPTVGLFGPTEPDIWFPYESLGPFRVLHHCSSPGTDEHGAPLSRLRDIEVAEVVDACQALLERGDG